MIGMKVMCGRDKDGSSTKAEAIISSEVFMASIPVEQVKQTKGNTEVSKGNEEQKLQPCVFVTFGDHGDRSAEFHLRRVSTLKIIRR